MKTYRKILKIESNSSYNNITCIKKHVNLFDSFSWLKKQSSIELPHFLDVPTSNEINKYTNETKK